MAIERETGRTWASYGDCLILHGIASTFAKLAAQGWLLRDGPLRVGVRTLRVMAFGYVAGSENWEEGS